MKKNLVIVIFCFLAFSASLISDEHHYFQEFPKYASSDLNEFCEQGIKLSKFNLCIKSTNYVNGYWQGQHDAYLYVSERLHALD